ncbi:serine--tRNA ligase [Aestuariispira insulae]|uniref:Serine--tRNA ligase n=1 Tax=Aestuariispira insulae TaxID=1461337 RepID=A0A3D9HNG3_9PROT|nr:serine--tRNA ligase [Aestuariispira insulae]RED51040.1 seryl-tRNA synthetase [Aestuariispira insulae]
MHDVKFVRENPEAFDAAMKTRGLAPQAQSIIELDEKRRSLQTEMQEMQARRNSASKEVGEAKRNKDDARAEALMAEVQGLKSGLAEAEQKEKETAAELTGILESLPNLPLEGVPVGADEEDNVEIRKVGDPKSFSFEPKQHFDLGENLGLMDFEAAARLSGARFVVLKGALARLERALANFMLDLHTGEHGLSETITPALVRSEALYGTGQLPKFKEDQFHTDDDYWLIPTAEVTLTNLAREEILKEDELPKRYTAWTQCFRSEAGSAGKDTRGMIRQHQFSKVEMVSIVHPDKSEEELERMTACAEEVLKRLGLAYRVIVLCTGDMGFGARKTYDIEVWLPGQDTYREISSCSNCGEFQARRMKARFRPNGEKGTRFVHTLNGSGLAVGRTMVAVLENYQNEDGSITVPDVLRPYMGGLERIEAPQS